MAYLLDACPCDAHSFACAAGDVDDDVEQFGVSFTDLLSVRTVVFVCVVRRVLTAVVVIVTVADAWLSL